MAIYHFAAQVLGRARAGRTWTGARGRGLTTPWRPPPTGRRKLKDERSGKAQDYSRRPGVAHREIIVPDNAHLWLADREKLWNEVERLEARRDAQLAREFNVALPYELNADQRRELVQGFVREQFVARAMVADFALHDPVAAKGTTRATSTPTSCCPCGRRPGTGSTA